MAVLAGTLGGTSFVHLVWLCLWRSREHTLCVFYFGCACAGAEGRHFRTFYFIWLCLWGTRGRFPRVLYLAVRPLVLGGTLFVDSFWLCLRCCWGALRSCMLFAVHLCVLGALSGILFLRLPTCVRRGAGGRLFVHSFWLCLWVCWPALRSIALKSRNGIPPQASPQAQPDS